MERSRRGFLKAFGGGGALLGGAYVATRGVRGDRRPTDLEEWPPSESSGRLSYWSWQHYWRSQAEAFQFDADLEAIDSETVPARDQYRRLVDGETPDVVTLPTRQFERAVENDLLASFDPEVVPFWPPRNELQTHDESLYVREDGCYGVPQTPMSYALAYHREELEEPSSWSLLWDESLAGRIGMPADPVLAGQVAALYTGQDPNDPDDVDAIRDALETQQSLVGTYWTDWNDCWRAFRDASIQAAVLPNPRMCLCSQDGTPIVMAEPDEGVLYGQNTLAIPKGASNPYTALEFIDWGLEFKTGTDAMWTPEEWPILPHRMLGGDTREGYLEAAEAVGISEGE
jgi:spermidine/putrescine transport system substrate-binding protein